MFRRPFHHRLLQAAGEAGKYTKQNRFDRMSELRPERHFQRGNRIVKVTKGGEATLARGAEATNTTSAAREGLQSMETPVMWVWYPWRRRPEPPTGLPTSNALKNLHGAVYSSLTPRQQKRQAQMMYGTSIPQERDKEVAAKHPFLDAVLKGLDGRPKGFPFWYKKYPTRRHAYETRFNIPREMLEGYSAEVKQAVSSDNMSERELVAAQKAMYAERYAEDGLDTSSPAVRCVHLAIGARVLRNHLLTNPHNNIAKTRLTITESGLNKALRRLRKIDFRRYWEIIRDHDMQDIIQPRNLPHYRYGRYWSFDWNQGIALTTNIPDFMDPRGMNGCIETGRARSEVARDLGLSYTRPLNATEKRRLASEATYHERLVRFRTEHPHQWREEERARFVKKFTGMFQKINRYSGAVDFPSKYRRMLGNTVLRWRSCRHGPM